MSNTSKKRERIINSRRGVKKGRGGGDVSFFLVRFRLIRAIFIFCSTRARLAHYLNRYYGRETITEPCDFRMFLGTDAIH